MTGRSRAAALALVSAGALVGAGAGCGDDVPRQEVLGPGCAIVSGNICTLAGTGIPGQGDDDLPALSTRLYLPQDTTLGPDGLLYVVDWNNHRVRVINEDGRMKIVAGVGELGIDSDDPETNRLNHPTGATFDATGRLVVAAWHNSKVKVVDLVTGEITDTCGNGKRGFGGNGDLASKATLDLPVAVEFDAAGNLLIADQANQMIRIVDATTGIIQTLAGTGHCADAVNPAPCVLGDDGPASAASFHFPIGQQAKPGGRIALGAGGEIYVADTGNQRVRKIDAQGIIRTYAGRGQKGSGGDGGPAIEAQLNEPSDVAVAPDGTLYVADTGNSCIRRVTPDGLISTFAGTCGQRGYTGNDGPASTALLDRPYGVTLSSTGDLYIADTHNQRIRVVYH